MKYLAQTIFLFTFLLIFSSCESETWYEYNVVNACSDDITVKGTNVIQNHTFNESVLTNDTALLAIYSIRGKQTDLQSAYAVFNDSLVITNASGDSLKLDFRLIENWEEELELFPYLAIHRYHLNVTDDDF